MNLLEELKFRAKHLAWLQANDHTEAATRNQEELLDITSCLEEHPDGYDGPCICTMCRSYGD